MFSLHLVNCKWIFRALLKNRSLLLWIIRSSGHFSDLLIATPSFCHRPLWSRSWNASRLFVGELHKCVGFHDANRVVRDLLRRFLSECCRKCQRVLSPPRFSNVWVRDWRDSRILCNMEQWRKRKFQLYFLLDRPDYLQTRETLDCPCNDMDTFYNANWTLCIVVQQSNRSRFLLAGFELQSPNVVD